jgi:hypothetical protein
VAAPGGVADGAGVEAAVGSRSGGTIAFADAMSWAGDALRPSTVIHISRVNRNSATARKTKQRILRSFTDSSQARTVLESYRGRVAPS